MSQPEISHAKQAIRETVWALLAREGAAPPDVHGYIPDFVGAEQAAARLAELDTWRQARVIKANPDRAQLPVRIRALQDGKLLYMAIPRLATLKPFYLLDPASLCLGFDNAATSAGAADAAPLVGTNEMEPVDLVVCGSVAVNQQGVRVGKGAGYSDIEVALLTGAGLISPGTTIITTVHQLQVVDADLPETEHDFGVDVIATPTATLMCKAARRPTGIIPSHLDSTMTKSIPSLDGHFRQKS